MNLDDLVDQILPLDASVKRLQRTAASLTRYAVDYRYPDYSANTRQMKAALRSATRVRAAIRKKLGLPL